MNFVGCFGMKRGAVNLSLGSGVLFAATRRLCEAERGLPAFKRILALAVRAPLRRLRVAANKTARYAQTTIDRLSSS
jgi:hypothetical protein